MAVLTAVRVGRDFRITIPKEVRGLLELEEGDEILFFEAKGWKKRVCLRKSHAH